MIHWWSKDVLLDIHLNKTRQSSRFSEKEENCQDRSQTADESANYQSHESQKE